MNNKLTPPREDLLTILNDFVVFEFNPKNKKILTVQFYWNQKTEKQTNE